MPALAGGGSVRRGLVWAVVATLTTAGLLTATVRPAMAHATLLSTTPTGDELLDRVPDAVEFEVLGSTGAGGWTVRISIVAPTATVEVTEGAPALAIEQASRVADPDDEGVGAGGLLAATLLLVVVVSCVVGFVRAARRGKADP